MDEGVISIFLDGNKLKEIEEAGLSDNIKEIDGKKTIQIPVSKKDKKKLAKGIEGLEFDAKGCCVLPREKEDLLFGLITELKTMDVMKVFTMKVFNPLAGKDVRSRVH